MNIFNEPIFLDDFYTPGVIHIVSRRSVVVAQWLHTGRTEIRYTVDSSCIVRLTVTPIEA